MNFNPPLKARNGLILVVGIVARISGCRNQKEVSLDDQEDHGRQDISQNYQREVEYVTIKTKGKGERIDRPELEEVRALIRSGKLDVLFAEDLGRMIRGAAAMELLYLAVDHGVRVVSPNDGIDTAVDGWEERAMDACGEHLSYNTQTSRRIKQKTMTRFLRNGKVPRRLVAGYEAHTAAKSYAEWKRIDPLTPLIQAAFDFILKHKNWTALAEWLNAQGFPRGMYAKNQTYDGASARRFISNPILKGYPWRGFMHSVKVGHSGARKSVKNPDGPKFFAAPHLAHVAPELYDEVQAVMAQENAGMGTPSQVHPLNNVSRKRSRFPGRCARCWYCGREFVWGGNGITRHLMCNGARSRHCWNAVSFNADLATAAIMEAIKRDIFGLTQMTDQFSALIANAASSVSGAEEALAAKLDTEAKALAREKQNVMAAVREVGAHPMLKEDMDRIEQREKQLLRDRHKLEAARQTVPVLPTTPRALEEAFSEAFKGLAADSYDFADALRDLVESFHVYLVRLCEGGPPVPRARVVLALNRIVPDLTRVQGMDGFLRREIIIDLFKPPQRARIREQVAKLRAENKTETQITQLIDERPTKTAVQRAMAVHREMIRLGLTDSYILLNEPPADNARLRRHKHRLYKFRPQEGYDQRPL